MSLKNVEVDDKEMELETWPAFVDILSSTVVTLAFAFFILVVILSLSKITTSSSDQQQKKSGGGTSAAESILLSEKTSEYPKLSIVSPPTLAKNQESKSQSSSSTQENKIIFVPENAKITNKEVKVTEPGESKKEVLGEIPKFTESRVMEVLKELVVVQQDVITQQRKVIEQQDTQIKQTAREYQSLLSVVTKAPEVESLKQKIAPKPDQARFNPIDETGEELSGASETPKGTGTYVLSPPTIAIKGIVVKPMASNGLMVEFKDNANYLNKANIDTIKKEIGANLQLYKDKGVTLNGKASDFSVSGAEGKRIAVDRLILVRSILIDMGVDKSLIKFKPLRDEKSNTTSAEEEENYGWVQIVPNQ